MTSPVPAVQRLGNSVVLSGRAVLDAHRLLVAGARVVTRDDGIQVSSGLRGLIETLAATAADIAMSRSGHADVPDVPEVSLSNPLEPLTVSEVSEMIGRTPRQVRRIADVLGGRQVGRAYVFERGAVESYLCDRAAS